jgi:DNA repair exonuclease SbcCD ATPase subunit
MDRTKIITVIFLVIILGLGFIAYRFYSENQSLIADNRRLLSEKKELDRENLRLQDRYTQLEREKASIEGQLSTIKEELSRIKKEKDNWQKRYDEVVRQRDLLAEKLSSRPQQVEVREGKGREEVYSEDYWADFVKKKAELATKLEMLNKELAKMKSSIAETQKDNREMNLKIDELTKENEELQQEIKFKERALNLVSRDLVSERQARKTSAEELNKLRRENVNLKRELVMAGKEKVKLQKQLQEIIDKKDTLQNRVSQIESILKEKSLALNELQEQLNLAIKGKSVPQKSTSVELPPIVVKPTTKAQGVRGEIIAVNKEERFVIIDKGEDSGLRPGTQLKVVRGDKEIGNVEVIETRREISAADIKEVVGGFNIKEGDKVIK